MKFCLSLFAGIALTFAQLHAASPSVKTPIPNFVVGPKAGIPNIDLRNFFAANPVIRFATVRGNINVELLPDSAPSTVANFLKYVDAGSFTSSFVHRSDTSIGVIQGGSFKSDTSANLFYVGALLNCKTTSGSKTITCASSAGVAPGMVITSALSNIPVPAGTTITAVTNATTITVSNAATANTIGGSAVFSHQPIALETADTLTNDAGTLAMARNDTPDTATSGWFLNTSASTGALPPSSSGGYAVFGKVVGAADLAVVDDIAALPITPKVSVTVTSCSTSSKVVNVSSVPAGLAAGWSFLGSFVASIGPGNVVNLSANADQTITSSTSVLASRFGDPLRQLPIIGSLGANLLYSNLVMVNSVARTSPFPSSPSDSTLVSFSVIGNTNPGLISVSVSGSRLSLSPPTAPSGSTTITIQATDVHGSTAQSSFTVTVSLAAPSRDFNGDGNVDLVFQNNSGLVTAWHMDGAGARIGTATLNSAGLGDWRLVAVGDVNNDGNADLVFQNTAGQVVAWHMNGAGARIGTATLNSAGLGSWRVVGLADMNNEGNVDLVFQNSTGQVVAWLMNGAGVRTGTVTLNSGGLGDWRVAMVADMNNDGNADLVFQNTAGQVVAWHMNGAGARIGTATLNSGGLGDWRLR